MNRTRPAAVAGMFYPQDPAQLQQLVTTLLRDNPYAEDPADGQPGIQPKALVVPHAGLVYSGPVAARAYNLLQQALAQGAGWRRVMLLGPNHRVALRGIAAPEAASFSIPGASFALDLAALQRLEARFGVQVRSDVHALEHSLEVQLPFIDALAPSLSLIPLVVGQASPEEVAALIDWAWQQEDMLVLISSDLSHYHAYAAAQRLDQETDRLITSASSLLQPEQACGCHALNGLLLAARRRGYAVRRLDLRNSGDTAGPKDEVVGYGSYAVFDDGVH